MSELLKAAEALREHSIQLGCAGPHGLEEVFALAARVLAAVEKVERMRLIIDVWYGDSKWFAADVKGKDLYKETYDSWLEAVEAVPEPAKGEEAQ